MPRMFFTFNANTFKTNASASNIKFPDTPEAHQIADMLAQKLYNHPAQKPSVDRDQRSSNLSTVFVDKDVAETVWPFITMPPEQIPIPSASKIQFPQTKIRSQTNSTIYPGCTLSVQQNDPHAPYISNAPGCTLSVQQHIKSQIEDA